MKNQPLFFFFAAGFSFQNFAQTDSLRGLQSDIMLHPCETFTGYTLQKNEVIVSLPVLTILDPEPVWVSWGATDRLTTELDIYSTFFPSTYDVGYMFDPTFNLRYRLTDPGNTKTALALETNVRYTFGDADYQDHGAVQVTAGSGMNAALRLNASLRIGEKLHGHASIGVSYNPWVGLFYGPGLYDNHFFDPAIAPVLSTAVDWRPKPWFSINLALGYGSTNTYLRLTPHSINACYGLRFAPFVNRKWGVFRTFRIEMTGYTSYFVHVYKFAGIGYPLLTQVYWQWTFGKKKKQP